VSPSSSDGQTPPGDSSSHISPVDILKPLTEVEGQESSSGLSADDQFVSAVNNHIVLDKNGNISTSVNIIPT
jgi:hypothetical protein